MKRALLALPFLLLLGCPSEAPPATSGDRPKVVKVAIQCNWLPEPQFGGIYHGAQAGVFAKHGIEADVRKGGPDIPAVQMAAAGKVEFALAAADEVIRIRESGADVVAVFATYQTAPQGIMTHGGRAVATLADLLAAGGTLAVQPGLAYVKFLEKEHGLDGVKLVPYQGGLGQFMATQESQDFAQQCFVTSEPLAAKREGVDTKVFLIADSGFNPYTSVVITRRDYFDENPEVVKGVVAALREAWRAYLDDPSAANEHMRTLNPSMDAETFKLAAEAQKPLIEAEPLGSMTLSRWEELHRQLLDVEAIKGTGQAADCFVTIE